MSSHTVEIKQASVGQGLPNSLFQDTTFKKDKRDVPSDKKNEEDLAELQKPEEKESNEEGYSLSDPNLYEVDGSGISEWDAFRDIHNEL